MRMTLPSEEGFKPRSDFMIARSMAALWLGSYGCATISVASDTERFATWFKGTWLP